MSNVISPIAKMDIHWADAALNQPPGLMNSLAHRVVVFYIFQEVKLTLIVGLTALYDKYVGDSGEGLKYTLNDKNYM